MVASNHPAVELRQLTKRFGTVLANNGVNLRVERGTIHGLIGENGAGKSTAMKLLFGMYQPDAGEILVDGQKRAWSSPADALACGIGMVHQHFMLAGPYSALDNILLGAEPLRRGLIDRRAGRAQLEKLAAQYGLAVDWDSPIEQLPVGLQQRIEILKLLYRNTNVLILDEPTAVLTPQEANELFQNLKRLRDEGKTILLVTHKLKEVMAVTQRVTVFRSGTVTGEIETSQTNPEELAFLMVGRKVVLSIDSSRQTAAEQGSAGPESGLQARSPTLEARHLTLAGTKGSRHRISDINFCVNPGEVVGLAGVEGNGQTELLQALLHPKDSHCRTSGAVKLLGQDVTHWKAHEIRSLGVAVIPEDRLQEGLLTERPVFENFVLGLHRSAPFSHGVVLDTRCAQAASTRAIEEYDIRPADVQIPAGKLSGGNQQKLIVAREFHRNPKMLIAAHPTRGVDVGAIEFIHGRIIRARDSGAAVLLISSELDELLALSDRILVLYEGRIVAEFLRGQVNERELGMKMGGL
jgi:simple sugar transport system ATP-binding protein